VLNFTQLFFFHDNSSDVDVDDLSFDILKFLKDTDCYPNISIAYRVLLIMSATVALAERSYSN
jgi:hypothetical protein